MAEQNSQTAEGASFKALDGSQPGTYDHLLDPDYVMSGDVEDAAVRDPQQPGEYSDWLAKNRGIDRAVGILQADAGLPDAGRSSTESAAHQARVAEIAAAEATATNK